MIFHIILRHPVLWKVLKRSTDETHKDNIVGDL
jgi:hypothetical protein